MTYKSVRQIMNTYRNVVVHSKTTVREAAELMAARGLGAVAVVADETLVGILTERDVLNRVSARRRDSSSILVEDAMTPDPQTIGPDESALDACERMQFGGFRHLPVVDGDRLVGMLSVNDLPFRCAVEDASSLALSALDGLMRRRGRQTDDRLALA